ncbi:MAG: tetraacyldisaccharide 4'-kinase, partial [Alloprevotella sp.]|nr:tetraacyldisaccharide 4'-kinase [Bacteroidales bacterium]MDY5768983.1 tetraacyldisaccharide 4'-kinase [Alloprevotella sp.]
MNLSLLLAPLTIPLSWVYDAVTTVRNLLFDRGVLPSERFPLPVIGVGNLAVGGTGKTPHVEHILRLLHEQGLRPAMLSRGYGRTTRGFRAVEEGETGVTCGDEPFQVSRNCPFAHVAVCEDRREGIRRLLARWQDTDVVVLDDAFQHRYVRPGLQILLTDA